MSGAPREPGVTLTGQSFGGTFNQFAGDQYNIVVAAATPPPPRMRTLRADIATFTGRDEQIQRILAGIADGTASICALDGMPGVGKTALALRVAHRIADRYPDGQLFVDLHAHSADHQPAEPAEVLAVLLAAAGVPPEQIPAATDERAAAWRDLVAGRRMLLLLDNAADVRQIAALLPGAASCLVLVTSRQRLAGLRRDYGATLLTVDTLPVPDAVALFARVHPRPLRADEHAAAEALVRLCGRLPLAITIVAAGADAEAGHVRDLLADLESARDRLAGIDAHLEDGTVGVASAFQLSYARLGADRQAVLRLLSIAPGGDIGPPAVAALTGLPLDEAHRRLRELHTHRLLEQFGHQRYGLHDLVGRYLRAKAEPGEGDPAVERLLAHYQALAALASDQLSGYSIRTGSTAPPDAPDLLGFAGAAAWMRAERGNLLAALRCAEERGWSERADDLTYSCVTVVNLDGPLTLGIELVERYNTAARRRGNRQNEAWALGQLGSFRSRLGDYPAARENFEAAVLIHRELGQREVEAWALHELGVVQALTGAPGTALATLEQALAIRQETGNAAGQVFTANIIRAVRLAVSREFDGDPELEQAVEGRRAAGDHAGEATALRAWGVLRRFHGDPAAAVPLFERALAVRRRLGDRLGEADLQGQLAAALSATGEHAAATAHLETALGTARELAERSVEADLLRQLGETRTGGGDHAGAAEVLREALAIVEDLGNRRAETQVLKALGEAHRAAGRYDEARLALQRAATIDRDNGNLYDEAGTSGRLATVLRLSGRPAEAAIALERAVEAGTRSDNRRQAGWAAAELGVVRRLLDDLPASEAALARSVAVRRDLDDAAALGWSLHEHGVVLRLLGEYARAAPELREALDVRRRLADRTGLGETLAELGLLCLPMGRWAEAGEAFAEARLIAAELGHAARETWSGRQLAQVRLGGGDRDGAVELLREAGARFAAAGDRANAAEVECDLGVVWRTGGDHDRAADAFERALPGATGTVELRVIAERGNQHLARADYPAAVRDLNRALRRCRATGDRSSEAWVLTQLGLAHQGASRYRAALRALERALDLRVARGERAGEGWARCFLAGVRRLLDDLPRASALGEAALEIFRAVGDPFGEASAQFELGVQRRLAGDLDGAAEWLRQAHDGYRRLQPEPYAGMLCELAVVHREAGRLDEAERLLDTALARARATGEPHRAAYVRAALGALRLAQGHDHAAAADLAAALDTYERVGDRRGQAEVLNLQGRLLLRGHDAEGARARHHRALALAVAVGSPLERARALAGAARCADELGDPAGAAGHRDADRILRRIGMVDSVD
ncbi:tetratricopeptide repeat protein [Dactylosporangium sp. NPDC049140]|uniref:tetratricopeptide repeat protein n=1 Tax=Dactylosporangium sp. NPDC049140 TaxID=3155647 RepID=UPI00340C17A9